VQPARKYLRGPALPGLADPAAFGHLIVAQSEASKPRPVPSSPVQADPATPRSQPEPTTTEAGPANASRTSDFSLPAAQSSALPAKLPAAFSPRHVKLPSSPIKTSFEVVAAAPLPPSTPTLAGSLPPAAVAESPSSIKLTHVRLLTRPVLSRLANVEADCAPHP
jgi:hypothetical protein